ncbi:MAG: ornithine cyclodeaminase [Paracoccus sp. (in: a-proteobacteria)]|uniref:ornithine cyclodeaminase family protein n=1 Tax=Paracoccus sp. TaxID=267 RepID=UPI0026DFCBF7|nr:ornithine cyclodeaminase [Paracoccus sp. (in: a-proteobacteria)]MDO5620748.1 ornithine cyclodeaminase [Paracoccus sp. (in: a-proteobacteria)]
MVRIIGDIQAEGRLSWQGAVEALRAGHLRERAQIGDMFLGPGTQTLLTRAAYIPGLGFGVKAFTVFDENAAKGLPTVQGGMMVYEPDSGSLGAVIEVPLVTAYKTAADSLLGASILARPDSRRLLIVGAGTLAGNLARAYAALFPGLERIAIWARRPEQARALVAELDLARAEVAGDLADEVAQADIISTATMARSPVIRGDWVRPGTHIDLIGAYKADMREADDALIAKGRLFVDSRETTIHHIGELMIPLAAGVISENDVLGDLYDLVGGQPGRRTADEITLFKNGGGAHLDLMTAAYIMQAVSGA